MNSIENGVTEYKILRPFKYYCKDAGAEIEASFITLHEPDFSNMKPHLKLQQLTTRLMLEAAELANKKKKDDETEEEFKTEKAGTEAKPLHEQVDKSEDKPDDMVKAVHAALMMSETVDASDMVSMFIKMVDNSNAKKPVAKIDGKYSLTRVHVERMANNDVLGVAMRWCAFFAMPDFLQNSESDGL